MCLIVLALGMREDLPFVLAGNRDEFHHRPADPLGTWADQPTVVGGRDREKGGSWLAVHRGGRFAAVTNMRDPSHRHPAPRSRGALVGDFVAGADGSAAHAAHAAMAQGAAFEGFNLLLADHSGTWYATNRAERPERLGPGVHGLSNHRLGTPWPKVRRARAAAEAALAFPEPDLETALFAVLGDEAPVADADLADTGIGLDWERLLATPFIRAGHYGTRASTVLLCDAGGGVTLAERRFGPGGAFLGETRLGFRLDLPLGLGATG
jgi:uncharacterized protein with NRDE domain